MKTNIEPNIRLMLAFNVLVSGRLSLDISSVMLPLMLIRMSLMKTKFQCQYCCLMIDSKFTTILD